MIRVAMGDVNFKIVPEASVFRGDADFDGPGAQKYHFRRKSFFWEIFSKIFSEKYFSRQDFSGQDFSWPDFFLAGCGELYSGGSTWTL